MGHSFSKNWYLYGSTFKFRSGSSLPKPNLSTSPPILCPFTVPFIIFRHFKHRASVTGVPKNYERDCRVMRLLASFQLNLVTGEVRGSGMHDWAGRLTLGCIIIGTRSYQNPIYNIRHVHTYISSQESNYLEDKLWDFCRSEQFNFEGSTCSSFSLKLNTQNTHPNS